MTSSQAEALEQQIGRLRSVCGCTTGAVVSILSVTIYLVVPLLFSLDYDVRPLVRVLIGAAVLFLSALIGKTTAILIARYRVKRLLAKASPVSQ